MSIDHDAEEFGTRDVREAALGNANVIAENTRLTPVNVLQCGLSAIAFAVVYVGDELRAHREAQ